MENRIIFREPDNANHHFSPIFNPLWRVLAHLLATKCSVCGRERLFSVFNQYLKEGDVSCKRCSLLSKSMMPLLGFVFSRLAVEDKTVKQLLKDPLICRCMLSVVKGIANFGIRYPQPTGAPVTVVWNFTNRCNLNCLHCHQDSSPLSSDSELTTSQAFKVIDNLSEAGVAILTFSGGEPLLRQDLYDVVKRACDHGMLCTVASNGTLISSEVAKRLSSAGISRVEIGLELISHVHSDR